jgi:AmmeMemoRadiSam system protein B
MKLPAGWYPRDAETIEEYLKDYVAERTGKARAVIAPHAGWFFSGKTAATAFAALDRSMDGEDGTVVIAGGHLPAGHPALFAEEDTAATPLGDMPINRELRSAVKREFENAGIRCASDNYTDNTVETLLPMARRFFPSASLLWLRLGTDARASVAGTLIARAAAGLGCRAVLVGSTDLTHYGPDYGFTPKGLGDTAVEWVKNINDRRLIEAVVSGDAGAVLRRAQDEHSACSAGAVLCAMAFSSTAPYVRPSLPADSRLPGSLGRLLGYTTSADILKASSYGDADGSFVGYAAISLHGNM